MKGRSFKITIFVILKLAVTFLDLYNQCNFLYLFAIATAIAMKHNSFLWQESECYFLLSTVESMAYGLNYICRLSFVFLFFFFLFIFCFCLLFFYATLYPVPINATTMFFWRGVNGEQFGYSIILLIEKRIETQKNREFNR